MNPRNAYDFATGTAPNPTGLGGRVNPELAFSGEGRQGMPTPGPPTTGLVQAALANEHIRSYLADPGLSGIWSLEGVSRHPTIRAVFEHAEVIGGSGESLAAARHKNFGRFLGIHPLRPDTPVHPCRILYIYKPSNAFSRRVEQRHALKRRLGREFRSLVTKASRSTKRDFLKFDLTPEGAKAIARRLKVEPGRFWRLAKGKEFLDLPAPPRQLLLFDDADHPRPGDD